MLAVVLLASATVASADVVAGPSRKDIRVERKELRQDRKELREDRKEIREDRKAGADAKELREDKKEIREDKKELREDRKAKREARRKELREKWGDVVKHPDARAELKVHARRVARLAQARKVAEADGKKELVARIDKLVEKENARHQRVMDRLKEKGSGGAP
ncbi:hypothetical protein [Polyangium mundeleinium]|uniref:Uncharacterized protein n=1 Tax=Polyangium mundeleinium TaxID=2995306 RepID=A0ABT5ENP4_9BACT|nr:hypothetical protein [Polyangium mundeleinium]MDC0742375.1 hypothetical protein [Polyangium mundeleinium]